MTDQPPPFRCNSCTFRYLNECRYGPPSVIVATENVILTSAQAAQGLSVPKPTEELTAAFPPIDPENDWCYQHPQANVPRGTSVND